MDSLDLLMPNTINWHAEEFPSDLQEVEPLLSDTAMNTDQMNGILGISDFSLDDLGFSNDFSDFNSVCNFNDSKSLNQADNFAKVSFKFVLNIFLRIKVQLKESITNLSLS